MVTTKACFEFAYNTSFFTSSWSDRLWIVLGHLCFVTKASSWRLRWLSAPQSSKLALIHGHVHEGGGQWKGARDRRQKVTKFRRILEEIWKTSSLLGQEEPWESSLIDTSHNSIWPLKTRHCFKLKPIEVLLKFLFCCPYFWRVSKPISKIKIKLGNLVWVAPAAPGFYQEAREAQHEHRST